MKRFLLGILIINAIQTLAQGDPITYIDPRQVGGAGAENKTMISQTSGRGSWLPLLPPLKVTSAGVTLGNTATSFTSRFAYYSFDGTTEEITGLTGDFGRFESAPMTYVGRPAGRAIRDPHTIKVGNVYWMAHTLTEYGKFYSGSPSYGISRSYDGINFQFVKAIQTSTNPANITWSPKWFVDSGHYYIVFSMSPPATDFPNTNFKAYWQEITEFGDDPKFSAATELQGDGLYLSSLNIDWTIVNKDGLYHLFRPYYDGGGALYKVSTKPFSGYVNETGPNTHLGYRIAFGGYAEGFQLMYLDNKWYFFYDAFVAGTGMAYRTSTGEFGLGNWSNPVQLAQTGQVIRNGNLILRETYEPAQTGMSFRRNGDSITLQVSYADGQVRKAKFKDSIGAGGGTTPPAGSTSEIQFNNGGSFGASNALTWDNTNKYLSVNPSLSNGGIVTGGLLQGNQLNLFRDGSNVTLRPSGSQGGYTAYFREKANTNDEEIAFRSDFAGGNYTPVFSNTSNVSISSYQSHFVRIGNQVLVDGTFLATATTAGASTTAEMTVPVPGANFSSLLDGTGILTMLDNTSSVSGRIVAVNGSPRVSLTYFASSTNAQVVSFHYQYTVK